MNEILLKLSDIKVHYGGVRALDGVSIEIDEGEIVALMGPNGAGKSTILKALFGLAPIDSGVVSWHSQIVKPLSFEMVERGVSFVPQGRRVFRNLTVRENLEVGGYIIKDKKLVEKRISEVLSMFPALKEKINQKSRVLSGGQQQMLAIARGLMTGPKVLLLDEPSLGLAPKIVKEVFEKIKEINERSKTAILIVEHNIKSVLDIVKRTYILDKGKLAAVGTPIDIIRSKVLEKVFLGNIAK